MSERKAVYYGHVELIPGIICDGYVLDDETAAMSILGAADLLSIHHRALQNIATNGIPKSLEPFWDKGLNIATKTALVVAQNSHYKGRYVEVCDSATIESLVRAYAFAFASDQLREKQKHIGKRCVFLMGALVRTALDAAIKEACGFIPDIQKTAQKHYLDAVSLIQELGFTCSVANRVATKKDLTKFLKVPESTLNSFLRKHQQEIKPSKLDSATIQSIGHKAKHMNGYLMDDVAKIAFGMDTEVGIELKRRMFGQIGAFAKPYAKEEIEWRKMFSKIFDGFDLHYSYSIGKYRVDFFVKKLMLALECNGYCHRYYDPKEEEEREKVITERYALVRFHHKISIETLFNGILQAKPGTVVTARGNNEYK
jgi:very-short-patch-repair endonuclease